MDAAFFVGLLVALRLLTRSTLVAALVGVAILSLMGSVSGFMIVGDLPLWLIIVFVTIACAALVALYTRVGILAGVVATFVLRPYQLLTTGFDTWYAGYGVADVALLLGITVYGLWVALAGQPVFRDMLAEPRAEKS